MFPKVICIAATLFLAGLQASAAIIDPSAVLSSRQDRGSLSFEEDADPFTIRYTTSNPSEKNYIGIWAARGGGPVNGLPPIIAKASLLWELAPGTEGTVSVGPEHLEPGEYTAFFLTGVVDPSQPAEYLAEPLNLTFAGLPANLSFPVKETTLHNASVGEVYNATVGGLILGRGNGSVAFEKVGGDEWLQVDTHGKISGTPLKPCTKGAKAVVKATAGNGSSASIRVNIPVRGSHQALVSEIAVMTYNLWQGGASVRNYHEKQLRFILESGVDIVGLQEAADAVAEFVDGESHVGRLGKALGWYSWSSNYSEGVISRYPIVEDHGQVDLYAGGVRIALNGDGQNAKDVNVWNTHTYPLPYGPSIFCSEDGTTQEVLEVEKQVRGTNMTALISRMQEQLDDSAKTPVLLLGDMNAPSHLDWIEALKEKNCGIGSFPWPTSKEPTDAGLIDSYRVAHPDVVKEPGNTWSPIHKVNEATGEDEPQDRIDFVYATKELEVLSSQALVVGQPQEIPDERDNAWSSDHAAVLTRFRLP